MPIFDGTRDEADDTGMGGGVMDNQKSLIITRHLKMFRCEMNRLKAAYDQHQWLRVEAGRRELLFTRLTREYSWILGHEAATLHQRFLYVRYWRELAEWCGIEDPGPQERYLSPQVRRSVLDRDHRTCVYCGRVGGDMDPDGMPWHVDHRLPASRGGSDIMENLALSCQACNLEKGTRTDEEYRYWMESRSDNG
jgi:5-methylcytosine-specific restriction endonuclease McrA